jgi:putative lipoprotein
MCKALLGCVLVMSLSACATTHHANDQWFGDDKMRHFLVSSAIGAAFTKISANNGAAPCHSVFIGISASLAIGSGKEWYDKNIRKTYFSWKDMFWDFAGGTLGSFATRECR